MKSRLRKSEKLCLYFAAAMLALSLALASNGCGDRSKSAASPAVSGQRTFATAEQAVAALETASAAGDRAALREILGPNSEAILNSGDPAEDQEALQSFVRKYQRMHRVVAMKDGSQILNIGADNYPFPIPLGKNSQSMWYFNSKAGEDEILARRIGRNELLAIDACSAIANAQELYARATRQYTTMIVSSPGKQDGLYWEVPEGQAPSPLGKLPDFARDSAAPASPLQPIVFDGYSFRILTAQGKGAKGGLKSYLENGRLRGGFAILATPARYQDSGVMSFLLSREGVVYEKDLGANTASAAAAITDYDPADGWEPVE